MVHLTVQSFCEDTQQKADPIIWVIRKTVSKYIKIFILTGIQWPQSGEKVTRAVSIMLLELK